MAISEETLEVVELLYKVYGSSSGYLFGIPPDQRHAVEAVVQCALELKRRITDDQRN